MGVNGICKVKGIHMKTKIKKTIKVTMAALTVAATVLGTACSVNIGGVNVVTGTEETKEAAEKTKQEEQTESSEVTEVPPLEDTGMFEAYIRAAEASIAEYDISKDEMAFELVHIDGDEIPELVISKPGYYVDVYTYYNGNLSHIMDYWPYGAGGNYGYAYIPYENTVYNADSDLAGALKWITLYKISDDHNTMDYAVDQSLTIRYYESDEVFPDDFDSLPKLDSPLYYYGDTKIPEDEFNSIIPGGEYKCLGKGVDYDTFMQCMNDKVLPDYSAFPYFGINEIDCTWGQATEYAEMNFGHLMSIDTEEKKEAVTSYLQEYSFYSKNVIYVGASVGSDGEFVWRSGEKIDPDLWLPGEPSGISSTPDGSLVDETCVVLIYNTDEGRFYLNDVPNDLPATAPYYQGTIAYLYELDYE